MSKPDVSVIIPVFNAEKTIRKAIESALRQTISEFEIICVDDGSNDSSVELIKGLQETCPGISLLAQGHQGAGPARNAGIKAAKGKYISFLDADDEFVDEKALDSMVKACEENQANICGSFQMVYENGEEKQGILFRDYKIPEGGCFIDYKDFQHDYDYQSFIYGREFLVRNDIWFPPYMRYQDPPFFINAMSASERFYVVPVTLYKYSFDPLKQEVVIKYAAHILQGIYDSLKTARAKGYRELFSKIVGRIDGQFHDAILQNLSDESMALLLSINDESWRFRGKRLGILSNIYEGMHGTQRLAYSHDLMWKIITIKQRRGGFQTYFEEQGIHTAAVYGLGVFGKILLKELEICGIEVVCGIDRSVTECGGLLILRPGDSVPACDALIVSLMEPEQVVRDYEKQGSIRIIAFPLMIQKIMEGLRNGLE